MSEVVLAARSVAKRFGGRRRLFARQPLVEAAANVTLELVAGRTVGLVGESGSGKTTVARMLAGLWPPTGGVVEFRGNDVAALRGSAWDRFRRAVQYVFQDPASSLNPRKRIRTILEGPLRVLLGMDAVARGDRVHELMELVGLRSEFLDRYPHELSGGQGQRVVIARALAAEPEVVILDEPTSALDVSIQAQILELLRDLQRDFGLTYLFISHDLAVVEQLADDVAVMQEGRMVEEGPRERVFRAPCQDYTRRLLEAVPVPGR